MTLWKIAFLPMDLVGEWNSAARHDAVAAVKTRAIQIVDDVEIDALSTVTVTFSLAVVEMLTVNLNVSLAHLLPLNVGLLLQPRRVRGPVQHRRR